MQIEVCALTAPHLHNGAFNSLEEVVALSNRSRGKSAIEKQALFEGRLHLSSYEKKAVVAFLKWLNDTAVRRLK